MDCASVRLSKAICAHDVAAVRQALEEGADVNEPHRGTRPLGWAIQMMEPDMVEMLLKAGADWRCVDVHGSSALELTFNNTDDDAIFERIVKLDPDAPVGTSWVQWCSAVIVRRRMIRIRKMRAPRQAAELMALTGLVHDYPDLCT